MNDFSYWGMKEQNTPSLAGIGKQVYQGAADRWKQALANEAQNTQRSLPSIEQLEQSYAGQEIPSMESLMARGTEKVFDTMNPLPASGLGMIVGKGAKIFNPEKVTAAKELLKEGLSKQDVAAKTGYYKDRAGNWKTQISDSGSQVASHEVARMKRMTPLDIRKAEAVPSRQLRSVLDHKELYSSYPWLATKADVKITPRVKYAAMSPKFDAKGNLLKANILVNPEGVRKYAQAAGMSYDETLRTMLLHEANHAVQSLDNLPNGNSAGWINEVKGELADTKRKLTRLKEVRRQTPNEAQMAKEFDGKIAEMEGHIKLLDAAKDVDSSVLYRHSIGEGDAFWTQSMKDDPNVMFKLPSHEYLDNPRLMQEGNTLPLQEKYINVTKSGKSAYMFPPEVELQGIK